VWSDRQGEIQECLKVPSKTRSADVIGNTILIARIATGEFVETERVKSAAAELGGKARTKAPTKKKYSEIAKKMLP